MWDCLRCAGWPCIPFFLFTFVIGNLVVRFEKKKNENNFLQIFFFSFRSKVLNLFLALLLASFGSNVLSEKEDEENKIGEAIDRIQRCFRFFWKNLLRIIGKRKTKKNSILQSETNETFVMNQVESNLNISTRVFELFLS